MNKDTKGLSREAMFNSRVEADAWKASRMEAGSAAESVVVVRNNVDTGYNSINMDRASVNIMDAITEGDKELVEAALKEAGIPTNQVTFFTRDLKAPKPTKGNKASKTQLGTATSKRGQELRLKRAAIKAGKPTDEAGKLVKKEALADVDAQIKAELADSVQPPLESIIEYLGATARSAGSDNWRDIAIKQMDTQFGHILDGGSKWNRLLFKEGASEIEKKAAQRYSNWLSKNISGKTKLESKLDTSIAAWEGRLAEAAETSFFARNTLKAVERIPVATQINSSLKFVGAYSKLLFFSTAQFAVQGSQAIASVSSQMFKHPIQATSSFLKLPALSAMHIAVSSGARLSNKMLKSENYKIYKEMVGAGYLADLKTTDTIFNFKHSLNPSYGHRALRTLKGVPTVPFRTGEAINRATAFVVARDTLAASLRKGNSIVGFDGKTMSAKDIGSQRFVETVVDKAKETALNMGKAGELELTSGFGGSFLQFKQILPKTISMYNSGKLSGIEKLGVLTGMVGMFGAGAIPLAGDILGLSDMTAYKLSGNNPNNRVWATDHLNIFRELVGDGLEKAGLPPEDFKRWSESGLISAATDGEINIATRVTTGSFLSDAFNVMDPWDAIVFAAITADAVEAADNIIGLGHIINPVTLLTVFADVKNGEDFTTALSKYIDPESTVGKLALSEMSLGSATQEAVREVGTVFSALGGEIFTILYICKNSKQCNRVYNMP